MSFIKYKANISEGDDVIVYIGFRNSHKTRIKWGDVCQTKYGAFRHEHVIGKTYGSRIPCTKGYVYILHPTPELWTQNVDHRTQILYPPDINRIILGLELTPGSVIVEAGTGSGALSHSIARTIHPGGHLHTFDFHEQRVEAAAKDFAAHDIGPELVTTRHADVCEVGFGSGLDNAVDAVFLDLPKPWLAIPWAMKALKKRGGRVCCFSPCIEQVQRSALALEELGFLEIDTIELLIRNLRVNEVSLPTLVPRKPTAETGPPKEDGSPCPKVPRVEQPIERCDPVTGVPQHSAPVPPRTFTSVLPQTGKLPAHSGYLTFATCPPVWET